MSLSTIRRWSDMGYLRSYRTPGGQRRFSVEQLDEFLESLESGTAARRRRRATMAAGRAELTAITTSRLHGDRTSSAPRRARARGPQAGAPANVA